MTVKNVVVVWSVVMMRRFDLSRIVKRRMAAVLLLHVPIPFEISVRVFPLHLKNGKKEVVDQSG
jgi:dolichyl-phosphate-mannose--protein O-mannosyl transferase